MRKTLVFATGLACSVAMASGAYAADKVTIQLKWVTQAQFAGYYVAKAKGIYKDADLDVTINPGGPDVAPPQVIAGGGADVVIDWMPSALASREKGVPLVNISQTFKKSGLELTCRKDTGIKTPADFKGKTIGVWFAGYKPDQLVVFKYSDEGVATLEDGLYVMEPKLKDPAFVAKMAKFVGASEKGWDWARKNDKEAAKIVIAADTTGAQTLHHQEQMMGEIAKLLDPGTGKLDPKDYDRTVSELLSGGSDPVITKKPTGAWTHAVYDAMK